MVALDQDAEVVSIISVHTVDAYCIARAGSRDGEGRFQIDKDTIQAEFHSPELSKTLYESFKKHDSEYLDELRAYFKENPTLEDQILEGQ